MRARLFESLPHFGPCFVRTARELEPGIPRGRLDLPQLLESLIAVTAELRQLLFVFDARAGLRFLGSRLPLPYFRVPGVELPLELLNVLVPFVRVILLLSTAQSRAS